MRPTLIAIAAGIVALLVILYSAIFIVTPTQQALVLQFGEVRNAVEDPGLQVKVPFIQDVVYLDKRILDLNVPAQEIIAADQKRLVVDAFARYRIENPVLFYQTVNNIPQGASRLSTLLQSSLRAILADATFQAIVRDDRPALMERIKENVQAGARNIGIEVVDVKIRRADLPEANSLAIYRRMQTERQQEAEQIRAEGEEAARRIRAQAERQATVIVAQASQLSEQIRGEGDAGRNAIFADAFGRDPEFFRFYRSMQAYERGLQSNGTRLVISPDSDFFRFFNDPLGAARASAPAAAPSPVAPPAPAVDGDDAPPGIPGGELLPEVRELLPDDMIPPELLPPEEGAGEAGEGSGEAAAEPAEPEVPAEPTPEAAPGSETGATPGSEAGLVGPDRPVVAANEPVPGGDGAVDAPAAQ